MKSWLWWLEHEGALAPASRQSLPGVTRVSGVYTSLSLAKPLLLDLFPGRSPPQLGLLGPSVAVSEMLSGPGVRDEVVEVDELGPVAESGDHVLEVSANLSGCQDASGAFNDDKDDSETSAGVRGAGESDGFSCDDKLSDGASDARGVELEEFTLKSLRRKDPDW